MKILKDLLLAMLNATMILLIALVISGIVLLNKASDFRDQTAAMLAPQAAQLQSIATSLEAISAGAQSAQTAAEVEQALDKIPDLSGLEEMTIRSVVQEVLQALGEWLAKAELKEDV